MVTQILVHVQQPYLILGFAFWLFGVLLRVFIITIMITIFRDFRVEIRFQAFEVEIPITLVGLLNINKLFIKNMISGSGVSLGPIADDAIKVLGSEPSYSMRLHYQPFWEISQDLLTLELPVHQFQVLALATLTTVPELFLQFSQIQNLRLTFRSEHGFCIDRLNAPIIHGLE
jgi:hypothetical protein